MLTFLIWRALLIVRDKTICKDVVLSLFVLFNITNRTIVIICAEYCNIANEKIFKNYGIMNL